MRNYLAVVYLLLLAGCATPTVKYTIYDGQHARLKPDDVSDTYVLSKTLLTYSTNEKTQENDVTASVTESRDMVIGITPVSKFGVTTSVNITKVKDSDLVAAVSSSVDDKRSEYVKSVGALLGSIATLGIVGSSDTKCAACLTTNGKETILDTLDLLKENPTVDPRAAITLTLPSYYGVLKVGAVPPDALEATQEVFSEASHVFLYSACRTATIAAFVNSGGAPTSKMLTFRLADPRFVEMVAFPTKGKLTAQDSCGVSVTSEAPTTESNVDVAKSAVDSLKDLLDQIKKAQSAK